jgi:hypothetical protein
MKRVKCDWCTRVRLVKFMKRNKAFMHLYACREKAGCMKAAQYKVAWP